MTPAIGILHIQPRGRRGMRLWLPLFLLWIPAVLLAPLLLLGFIGSLACGVGYWRGLATLWRFICALSGTDVRVDAAGTHVLVRLI
jgi:hypothetical protein